MSLLDGGIYAMCCQKYKEKTNSTGKNVMNFIIVWHPQSFSQCVYSTHAQAVLYAFNKTS